MKKSKVILFIDTSDHSEILVAIEKEGKRFEKKSSRTYANAQMVLPLIEGLLKDKKLSLSDISEIKVHTGPGSFTGLRVGLAVVNMLGTLLNIPVNGRKPAMSEVPRYGPSKLD